VDIWHALDADEVQKQLDVAADQGLTGAEVESRRSIHGPNVLDEGSSKGPWRILAEQFMSLLVILLVVAAFVSAVVLGEWVDGGVILVVVILNALLGFSQEFRAEKAMAALKKLTRNTVRVRRDGAIREVKSDQIVPGDVVFLEAGNLIAADCRLLEAADLRVEEAPLTGESVPVTKQCESLGDAATPVGDRVNMGHMGTVVTYGRGVGLVVGTGMDTELGKIAGSLQAVEKDETPLQKHLAHLGRILIVVALVLIAVVVVIGLVQGKDLKTMFLTAVSMAVAAVPEGLPAVVTIALAVGAQRMLRRNALIRKLPAVETLGSVTAICSDKTGTLTRNQMTVTQLVLPDKTVEISTKAHAGKSESQLDLSADPAAAVLLCMATLCNDAAIKDDPDTPKTDTAGDPTEGALLLCALDAGFEKEHLDKILPRIGEAPFDSDRKRMTTLHEVPADRDALPEALRTGWEAIVGPAACFAAAKGGVESLSEVCDHIYRGGQVAAMTQEVREELSQRNADLAGHGVRVLGVAWRGFDARPSEPDAQAAESEMVFLGMVGMVDPIRPEVREAVGKCVSAGIRPVMITGDHPLMARYIARKLGMVPEDDDSRARVMTGRELTTMSADELSEAVKDVSVYARVAPEDKLNIVDALQAHGEVVAMTGDGVNDAPALKSADIGVAMGITGTDVSKEASDMVLEDDNFTTVVAAVEEGRTIFANIRRFIRFLLACNTGELWVFLIAPFFGMPLPLLPVQILWMNLVTDGLPAMGLGLEPSERDIMSRPPRDPAAPIIDWMQGVRILWIGLLIAVLAMAVGYGAWRDAGSPAGIDPHAPGAAVRPAVWQTMLFCTMVFAQLFLAFSERSDRYSLLTIGLLSNKYVLISVIGALACQLGVVYLPLCQTLFKTAPLTAGQLGLCIATGMVVLVAAELDKAVRRARSPIRA